MTRTTITGVTKAAMRWVAVPALAALALAATAAPALADETAVNLNPTASITTTGQLTVSGTYQCDPATAAYAEISVSVTGSDVNGAEVDATTNDRVACTSTVQSWQETLTPTEACETFAAGPADVEATAWTPGDWDGQTDTSVTVSAS
jgi:hypothetical protein